MLLSLIINLPQIFMIVVQVDILPKRTKKLPALVLESCVVPFFVYDRRNNHVRYLSALSRALYLNMLQVLLCMFSECNRASPRCPRGRWLVVTLVGCGIGRDALDADIGIHLII